MNAPSKIETLAARCVEELANGPSTTAELGAITGHETKVVAEAMRIKARSKVYRRVFDQTTLWMLPEHASLWGGVPASSR